MLGRTYGEQNLGTSVCYPLWRYLCPSYLFDLVSANYLSRSDVSSHLEKQLLTEITQQVLVGGRAFFPC